MLSFMCTGIRIVRDWSAMARVIAWRITRSRRSRTYSRRYSNLSAARINPMLPSWIRSRRCSPRLTYFLATETTRRRLASTRSSWRAPLPAHRDGSRSGYDEDRSKELRPSPRACESRGAARADAPGPWLHHAASTFFISRSRWFSSSTARSISRLNCFHFKCTKGIRRIDCDVSTFARQSLPISRFLGFFIAQGHGLELVPELLLLLVEGHYVDEY